MAKIDFENDELDFTGTGFENKSWATAKNVKDLTKMIENMEGLIGRKGTIIPKDSDDDEAWNKFYVDMKAKPEEYKELLKDKISDKYLDKIVDKFEKTGVSKRQAKELSEALGDVIKNNFQEYYSKDKYKEKLSSKGITEEQQDKMSKIMLDTMGEDWMKQNEGIVDNDSAIAMLEFAQGLTTKMAIKEPIEPTAKPGAGQPDASDPFLKGLTKSMS